MLLHAVITIVVLAFCTALFLWSKDTNIKDAAVPIATGAIFYWFGAGPNIKNPPQQQ
jgi:hypothetical protein